MGKKSRPLCKHFCINDARSFAGEKKEKKIDITKTTNMCHFHSHEDDKSESADKIW